MRQSDKTYISATVVSQTRRAEVRPQRQAKRMNRSYQAFSGQDFISTTASIITSIQSFGHDVSMIIVKYRNTNNRDGL